MPMVFQNKYEKEHSRAIYHTDPSPLINNPPAFRLQKPSTKDRAKGHCGHPLGIRSDTCHWFWGQVTIFWQIFHFTKSFICWLVLIELPLLTGTRTEHSPFKVAFYVQSTIIFALEPLILSTECKLLSVKRFINWINSCLRNLIFQQWSLPAPLRHTVMIFR